MKESAGQRSQGSKSKCHLQRTVSCSWGILQGLHHTALWSDKEESPFQVGRSSTRCCLLPLDPFPQKRPWRLSLPSTSEATLGVLTHHSLPLPPLFTILLSVFVHLQGRTMAVCSPRSLQTCTGSLQPPRSPPFSLLE